MAGEKVEAKPAAAAPAAGSGLTNESKLWAALCYVFPVLMFILVYISEDKKKDKFILFHAWQSLFAALAGWAVVMVIAVVTLGIGGICFPVYWLVLLYFGYKAYQGERFVLPTIGEYAEKQMK
jgi:uncharacterized membrane protein